MQLLITNPATGLSKTVDVATYTLREYVKTFSVYVNAGFSVKILNYV